MKVAEDPTRPGQSILIATRDIAPGDTLFCEAPLILAKSERGVEAVGDARDLCRLPYFTQRP